MIPVQTNPLPPRTPHRGLHPMETGPNHSIEMRRSSRRGTDDSQQTPDRTTLPSQAITALLILLQLSFRSTFVLYLLFAPRKMASSSTTRFPARSNAPALDENSGALIKSLPPDLLLVIFIHGYATSSVLVAVRGLRAVTRKFRSRLAWVRGCQVQGNGFDVQFVPKALGTRTIKVDR